MYKNLGDAVFVQRREKLTTPTQYDGVFVCNFVNVIFFVISVQSAVISFTNPTEYINS